MNQLQIRIVKKWGLVSCFTIAIFSSLNSFAQESNTISEEKQQERYRRHLELQQIHKDSVILIKSKTNQEANATVHPDKKVSTVEHDTTFPVFVNTGNPEQDNLDYRIRKDQWIKENPEKYKNMQTRIPLTEAQQKEIELQKQLRLKKD